ncbi:hypothetical protein BN946_scf185002.g132 [Trametes cinnabarina]|uniref:Integrase catalytic domain-containing protein n=1 Tax=Pycnoporus cinnabarinus TaxID=5643 RepID=A0A060SEK8_PYCCI|nr:hypothetical protein BN946_scf185002.g132 [Trametes cinnabarina]
MNVDDTAPASDQCRACIEAKQRVLPFPKQSFTRIGEIGDLAVCDMWGPARHRGAHGEYYFTLFTDVCTRYAMRYFSSDKKHQLDALQAYHAFLKNQKGIRLKAVRVNNGKEFLNRHIKGFLRVHGISLELTAPHSSAQNGIAERSFLTLWPEAVNYAVYLKNRVPTRAIPDKTPYEAFWGKKPDVSNLHEFGAVCWVLRQDSSIDKLARKSRPCRFLGFSEESRAYRLYDPTTQQVITSRNVVFDRTGIKLQGGPSQPPLAVEGEQPLSPKQLPEGESDTPPAVSPPAKAKSATPPPQPTRTLRHAGEHINYCKSNNPDARKPAPRFQKPSQPAAVPEPSAPDVSKIAIENYAFALITNTNDDPQSLAEAQARSDWPEWKAAMDREIEQLQRLGTYTLVPCPPDRKPIGCKWVFRLKRDADGRIIKHKARLVAQGFSQIPGIDYVETFAPVVRLETLRVLLALGTLLDYDIQVADIVGAYLNGHLREEIFMRQPPMYENGRPDVCKLERTLYGLKQSGREWNLELDQAFKRRNFKRLISDQCVYLRARDTDTSIVAVHVDDMTMLTSSPETTDALKQELSAFFELSDLGPIRQVVGLEVTRDRAARTLTLRQTQYIDR